MTYYYDTFGWLTNTVMEDRSTELAPPSDVQEGYKPNWTGVAWIVIPYTTPPVENQRQTIKTTDFMLLFTSQERIAIRASTNPVAVDFLRIIDDPRLLVVDLNNPAVSGGLAYFVSIGLLTADRPAKILAGQIPI